AAAFATLWTAWGPSPPLVTALAEEAHRPSNTSPPHYSMDDHAAAAGSMDEKQKVAQGILTSLWQELQDDVDRARAQSSSTASGAISSTAGSSISSSLLTQPVVSVVPGGTGLQLTVTLPSMDDHAAAAGSMDEKQKVAQGILTSLWQELQDDVDRARAQSSSTASGAISSTAGSSSLLTQPVVSVVPGGTGLQLTVTLPSDSNWPAVRSAIAQLGAKAAYKQTKSSTDSSGGTTFTLEASGNSKGSGTLSASLSIPPTDDAASPALLVITKQGGHKSSGLNTVGFTVEELQGIEAVARASYLGSQNKEAGIEKSSRYFGRIGPGSSRRPFSPLGHGNESDDPFGQLLSPGGAAGLFGGLLWAMEEMSRAQAAANHMSQAWEEYVQKSGGNSGGVHPGSRSDEEELFRAMFPGVLV
ncbi:hypothetical protein CEUSTIGMA_g11032.t1, partial [Chlamydomonas eustigma]